jgi:hypothetical protein
VREKLTANREAAQKLMMKRDEKLGGGVLMAKAL